MEQKHWAFDEILRKRKKREEIVESERAVGGLAPPDCEFKKKLSFLSVDTSADMGGHERGHEGGHERGHGRGHEGTWAWTRAQT